MRSPLVLLAAAFGAGLWAGLAPFPGAVPVLPVLVATVLLGAGGWRLAPAAPRAALALVAAGAGILWGSAAAREASRTCVGRWSEAARGSHAAVVQLRDPVTAGGAVVDGDSRDPRCGGTIPLRWPGDSSAEGGTTWLVAGRWLGEGARGVLQVRRARLLDPRPRGRGGIRNAVSRRARALFGSRAPLVDALVLARRNALDPDVRERFAQAGLAHLLCVAGLHVGFLAGWLGLVLGRLPLSPRVRFGAGAALVLLYVWLLGFPAPATRAAIGLAIFGFARLRQRVVPPLAVLALTALILGVVDPDTARSVGAWLSFAAVAAVFGAVRATAGGPWPLRALAPGVAATLVTAPITAYAFGTVAPVGVLANLVAIPLAGVAIPGAMLALLASAIAPAAGALLARGAGTGLAVLDLVARAGDRVPFGHLVMAAGVPAALTWLAILAVCWWLWRAPGRRRPWVRPARALFVGAIVVWSTAFRAPSLDECRCLSVSFLDVGQGDAAALRTPAGQWIVIDGGPRAPGNDAGRRVVVPYLRRHGARGIALMVSTHADADHLGGLPAVVAAFPPRLVLEPGEPLARPLYFEFLAAVEAAGSRWRAARAGDRITVDGVEVRVLSPDDAWMHVPVDVNDHGVVVLVTYGATRIFFQADAGIPVERRLAGSVGPVDLLKVGHHGSRSASSEAWLAELAPRVAVISVGARNRYGHPAPEVLDRLARRGIEVLRTDQRGTITFTSDGHHVPRDVGHHD